MCSLALRPPTPARAPPPRPPRFSPSHTHAHTLFCSIAPEILKLQGFEEAAPSPAALKNAPGYSDQVDSWSLGVLAYMLLSGQPPFKGSNDRAVLTRVRAGKFSLQDEPWADVSESAKSFVRSMLIYNPAKRMTAEAALNHPWLLSAKREGLADAAPLSAEVLPSLRRFAHLGGWKRAALEVVAFSVPDDDQIKHLRAAFQKFDVHSNGYLSWPDFEAALLGAGVGREEARSLFTASALGHEDGIHWSNFLAAVLPRSFLSRERLRSAFDALDVRQEGVLTLESFTQALADDKDSLEINTLFDRYGARINFETFFAAFTRREDSELSSVGRGGTIGRGGAFYDGFRKEGEGSSGGRAALAAAEAGGLRKPSALSPDAFTRPVGASGQILLEGGEGASTRALLETRAPPAPLPPPYST